jgi:septal ring factor EnvC (AmiA/AmiB activator)
VGFLPVLIGGGGLAGIAAVIGTLFLSRSQRDLNLANAAGRLVDASDVLATNLQEDLAAARAELAGARAQISALSDQIAELNRTVGTTEVRVLRAEAERDACHAEIRALRAQLGGRREGDTSA